MLLIKETNVAYVLEHDNKILYLLKDSNENIIAGNKLILELNYIDAINQYKLTTNNISYNNIGVANTLLNEHDLMTQNYIKSCCSYSYLNLANNTVDKNNVLNYYTIAITLNKNNCDVIFDMAKYYEYYENDLAQAIKYYEMLCDNQEYKAQVLYNLTIIFYDQYEEYDNFEKYSLRLLNCDDSEYVKIGRRNLGEYYFDMFCQNQTEEYKELMFKYLDPSDGYSAYLLGSYFTHVKLFVEAEEFLKIAILQNSHNAAILLGKIYEAKNQSKLAEEYYKKAITICDCVDGYYNLALLYLREKKYVFAEKVLLELIYEKHNTNSMLLFADYYKYIKKNDIIAKKYYIMNYQITKNINVLQKFQLDVDDIEIINKKSLNQDQLINIIFKLHS